MKHTVGPVLDEKLEAFRPSLRQAGKRFRDAVERKQTIENVVPDKPGLLTNIAPELLRDLFDVKVLDPAMGSGHFLVEAVDFITDRMLRFLNAFPFVTHFFEGQRRTILEELERQKVTVDPARLTDVNLLKRHVLKRCVYGVDLNPMAVELAKVGLWLDCFTLGAPLSFLDHHLRCGNSLIGTTAREADRELQGGDSPQMTFLTGPFVGLLRSAEIMRGISAIGDATVSQVRESASLFRQFEEAAKPYKQLLDVFVIRHFGVGRADEFLRLYGADAMRAEPKGLEGDYQQVLAERERLYRQHRFFHWDLEFPEVFIDLGSAAWKANGGFDAVIGNPPYDVLAEKEREEDLRQVVAYVESNVTFRPAVGRKMDLFRLFLAKGMQLAGRGGCIGEIVPMSLLGDQQATPLRRFLLREHGIARIEAFPQKDDADRRVFPEAKLPTCIIVAAKQPDKPPQFTLAVHPGKLLDEISGSYSALPAEIEVFDPASCMIPLACSRVEFNLAERLSSSSAFKAFRELAQSYQGEINETTMSSLISDDPSEGTKVLRGGNVQRYSFIEEAKQGTEKYLQLDRYKEQVGGERSEHWKKPRLGYQRNAALDNWRRLIFTRLPTPCHCFDSVSYLLIEGDVSYSYLALLNSSLLEWRFRLTSSNNHVSTDEIGTLPVPDIAFASGGHVMKGVASQFRQLYAEGTRKKSTIAMLHFVDQHLSSQPPRADLIRDFLAFLAKQMIDLNEKRGTEQARFLGWLGSVLRVRPGGEGEGALDVLTGKTTLRGYLGDYQKGEQHSAFEEIADILHRNRTRLGISLDDAKIMARLKAEYEKSLGVLLPIKENLAFTDKLIDEVVYLLYGLTEEEIAVVEGRK